VAGNRLQQMKAWNLWWTTLTRVNPSSSAASTTALGTLFILRCFADEQLSQLKVRRTRPLRAHETGFLV
jgi:hypothetical protein